VSDKNNDEGEESAGVVRDLGPATLDAPGDVPLLRATWNSDGATVDQPASLPAPGAVDFARFFLAYWPRLTRRLLGPCRQDRGLAEDIAQEAIYATYRRIDKVNDPEAYAYKVACRAAQRHLERQRREAAAVDKLAADGGGEAHPDARIAFDDLLRRVLTERQQTIIHYRFVERQSLDWIADKLHLSARTISSEIKAARDELRPHLRPEGEES
jgi:RNA polymerase sigma factor (sigma-70 family)